MESSMRLVLHFGHVWRRFVWNHPHLKIGKKLQMTFDLFWQFPNCIGASGSLYYNYKGWFSVVLMALVDAYYCFIMIDVGAYGRNSDGAIFANSEFGKAFLSDKLGVPCGQPLPGAFTTIPFTIVADEAFALQSNVMWPFPRRKSGMLSNDEKIFNYRVSRACMKVENAFGILSQWWRVYYHEIDLQADYLTETVLATCALHNFLQHPRVPLSGKPIPDECVQGDLGSMDQVPRNKGHNYSEVSRWVRNMYVQYFVGCRAVSWQNKAVGVTCENNWCLYSCQCKYSKQMSQHHNINSCAKCMHYCDSAPSQWL